MKINSKTVELMRGITHLINSSELPPCVVGLVLDKLRAQISTMQAKAIQLEKQQEQKDAESAAEDNS